MNYSEGALALLSAQDRNILPITSICNVRCLFCSHRGNPKGIETYSLGHRPLEEIKDLIEFLDEDKKVVIGESITRICEGEPFTHPQVWEVLELLRTKLPKTKIQLTTNGKAFTRENLEKLKELEPIEINLSLNSATLKGRKALMKDIKGSVALEAIKILYKLEIDYHGSIVAMPHITGWDDLEGTIDYLADNNAQTIRVFLPGYTKFSPQEIKFDLKLWGQLEDFIQKMRNKYQTPITLEPSRIEDLRANVIGIIKDSPSYNSKLLIDDIILEVQRESVQSRVDAFHKVLKAKDPVIKVSRKGEIKELIIKKEAKESSGLVFDYDIDTYLIDDIDRIIRSCRAKRVLILTSQLAEKRIELVLKEVREEVEFLDILVAKNYFFGGTILSAGLLVLDDFRKTLKDYRGDLENIDLIILPAVSFDNWGNDLKGDNYYKLVKEFGVEVEVI
ncbi:DUF512 domain-containing protein [Halonatronum saccharophilum]|uniref:DUF512 domain-containing protein n=1 Tax=Halonatronum saccharophilum TaxID=150060 RepID=UPI0004ACD48E|nr:DUF512 domain-containing protein [Halonatronum saccharophilum]